MKSKLSNLAICSLLIAVIFLFDLNVPFGIGSGALYVFVIILGSIGLSNSIFLAFGGSDADIDL
ncbi:hypothetical protein [Methylococcus sp. EFPC2]|uniref:hypothetical protein n=1 Tax=Methylococcus sp. EFPC2 TaxID=2812648 RepID=UPI001966D83B|nr:hypothetical protein [Methylococcus sp. EFPC2]QSA97487.1 hypothetical protein JWZ97_01160 [Methylococcus sp. EFPC2]